MGTQQRVWLKHQRQTLVCATWNVRGLTKLKEVELILHMRRYDIDILCVQETRVATSSEYTVSGFVFILSGSDGEERSWNGVGFIIAPWCRWRLTSYKQISDRVSYAKLKVPGGVAAIFSVYAPHNLKPTSEKVDFYNALETSFRECSANQSSSWVTSMRGWEAATLEKNT